MQRLKEYLQTIQISDPTLETVTITAAILWTQRFKRVLDNQWVGPHCINSDLEGSVVYEWWCKNRKITLYIEPTNIHMIKSWGPDMDNEMESIEFIDDETIIKSWDWLWGKNVKN